MKVSLGRVKHEIRQRKERKPPQREYAESVPPSYLVTALTAVLQTMADSSISDSPSDKSCVYTVTSVIPINKYHKCRACALPCINCNSSAHATRFPDKLAGRAPAEFGIPRDSVDHVTRSAFALHPRLGIEKVEAVLGRETDFQQADPESEILKELDDETTSYAILSHRWIVEVGYEEMTGLMKMEERRRDEVRRRAGYQKIIKSCEQAKKDGYVWLWVDTCCIDKRSSAELSEAINSMYRWYKNARVCYAYLNDVGESTFPTKADSNKFAESNGWPEWFVRGWTLQELIAPQEVKFFNKDWVHIGNKGQLALTLWNITAIPCGVLTSGLAGKALSVAQIMSWAARRKTTRVEDRAYSLMGLFGVSMPMVYGEGKKAFRRLQLEIIREYSDQSIFAWNPRIPRAGSVLAEDPSDFWNCGHIERVDPDEFVDRLTL
ncbi:heterokaryon incompatibility protein-domain-containing protein [Pisolithus albus]|nr:heterokaryon incompatibility protein-domain-containing protein [Pisolithus albus]